MDDKILCLQMVLDEYCEKVIPNLFGNSANISAKKENIVSYPTHIINAVFTASSLYGVYHLNPESKDSVRNLKLLISVITLHDIGKYLKYKYGTDGGNSKENIKRYFESDDFKIKTFFPYIEEMIRDDETFNEIVWLIQNTELRDDSRVETLKHKTGFGKLAEYSRLGDKIASLTKYEHYVSKIFDTLKYYDVHVVKIPKFPHFLIRRCLLKTLKEYHEKKGAIPFLLFEDGLFYINKGIIPLDHITIKDDLVSTLKELIRLDNTNENKVEGESSLNIRINFQSIDDTSVLNSPLLEKEKKKKIILEQIINNLPKAMKGVSIALPTDKKIDKEKLATVIYYIYSKKSKDLKLLNNTKIKAKINSLKNKSEGGVGPQKYKIYIAKELIEKYNEYKDDIESVYEKCEKFINEQIELGHSRAINIFDNLVKNISVDLQQVFEVEETPKNKDELCFLCGSRTEKEYRAEEGYFLQARGFSKRGKIFDKQKKICSLCLLEKNLIEGLLRDKEYKLSGEYLFAAFYFDRIFANVSYFSSDISNVQLEPKVPIGESSEFRLGDFEGMYYIVPYTYSGKENSSMQSNRVDITRQVLDFIDRYGCKATLTSPFTLLRTYNDLFVNENPSRLEISLNAHIVHNFDELCKIKKFLNIIHTIDKKKGYFEVQNYNLFSFIHFLKINNNLNNNEAINVVKSCFESEIMKIEEIAKIGKELYSTGMVEWESAYKRTVLIRTALDYILIGIQQRLAEEELKTFVAGGIYKLSMREKYAKKKDIEELVEKFVDTLIQYLKEKGWLSVHSLSSIEKYIVDAYEFALISSTQ